MLFGKIKKIYADSMKNRFGIIEYDEGQKWIVYFMQKEVFESDPFTVHDEVSFIETVDAGAFKAERVKKINESCSPILLKYLKSWKPLSVSHTELTL